ncbi:MAG: hypothetical protein DMG38_19540 [Acidobacteria bacterium]|nr:MAG: hypothetical protein DMG38_19540 [Acidobacteriota bacterium]
MGNVAHTVDELIAAVGATYRAIDIRSVAILKQESWVNVMAAVRLTYEDVETANARLAKLAHRFPPVRTELLRIDSCVRPFKDWPDFCLEIKLKGALQMGEVEFQLRQKPDLPAASGYIQWGYSRLRSFDGRAWPGLTINFDIGGMSPLFEGQYNREAHLLGYGDALEAVNALCELNVSQQDFGCDLSFCFPVFVNISQIRVNAPKKRIDVEVQRHRSFSGLRAIACVRGQTVLADAPFREQISLRLITQMTPASKLFRRRALYKFKT